LPRWCDRGRVRAPSWSRRTSTAEQAGRGAQGEVEEGALTRLTREVVGGSASSPRARGAGTAWSAAQRSADGTVTHWAAGSRPACGDPLRLPLAEGGERSEPAVRDALPIYYHAGAIGGA